MIIKTASWFTKLPADHQQVGISRGVPRGTPGGYKRFRLLEPGPWFKTSTPDEYLRSYGQILAALDPAKVAGELVALSAGKIPTLLCFENASGIAEGKCWCHRSIVAQWFEDRLGVEVLEVGHENLDRWALLRAAGVTPPTY